MRYSQWIQWKLVHSNEGINTMAHMTHSPERRSVANQFRSVHAEPVSTQNAVWNESMRVRCWVPRRTGKLLTLQLRVLKIFFCDFEWKKNSTSGEELPTGEKGMSTFLSFSPSKPLSTRGTILWVVSCHVSRLIPCETAQRDANFCQLLWTQDS